jgi:hypothetical protein
MNTLPMSLALFRFPPSASQHLGLASQRILPTVFLH